jgi:hypothetical protein
MEKILIYTNDQGLSDYNSRINRAVETLTPFIEVWGELPLRPIDSMELLKQLAETNDIEDFVAKMLPEAPKIFGMPVNAKKALDLLDIDLKPLKQRWEGVDRRGLTEFCDVARLTKKGFEVDPKKLAQVVERYKRYATTEGEKAVNNAIQGIKTHFDTLHRFGLRWPEVTKLFNYSPSWPDRPLTLHTGTFNMLAEKANKK